MPPPSGAIKVTDRTERRIRKPIDLLRCITSFIEIVALVVAGVAASATTTGAETDIIEASGRLPQALRVLAPPWPCSPSSSFRSRWPSASSCPAASAAARRGRRYRRPGRGGGGADQRRAAAEITARLYDAIIMSRPAGPAATPGARSVPGRPGRVRDHHGLVRARLAERPVAGRRRLRSCTWRRPTRRCCRSCSRCSSAVRSASRSGTRRAARRCVPAPAIASALTRPPSCRSARSRSGPDQAPARAGSRYYA